MENRELGMDETVKIIDDKIWDDFPKEPLDRILRIENLLGYGRAKTEFTHISHTPFKERLEKERDELKQEILKNRKIVEKATKLRDQAKCINDYEMVTICNEILGEKK